MAMHTAMANPTAVPASVTPPAAIANLLSYSAVLTLERMNTGRQRRRIGTWTYSDISDCDHAKERDQRKKYFHNSTP
jgi:hypothetical protein